MLNTEVQYVVVRYMLNEFGDEAANVGLIAVVDDPPQLITKALENPESKSRSDARVRSDVVTRFMNYANAVTQGAAAGTEPLDARRIFEQLTEISGGLMRLSLPKSVLTNNVEHEVASLYKRLVAPTLVTAVAVPTYDAIPKKEPRERDPLGGLRRAAQSELISHFRKGYGRMRRDAFTRSYPVNGAKHKSVFDLAMIVESARKRHEHLFHHVIVLPDTQETFNQAAGLCVRWNDVQASNGASRRLTAVLYAKAGPTPRVAAASHEASKLLKEKDIEVLPMRELPSFAHKLAQGPQLIEG